MNRFISIACVSLALFWLASCGKPVEKSPGSPPSKPSGAGPMAPAPKDEHAGHTHKSILIGSVQAGPYTVKASHDEGEIKPGAELHLDVEAEGAPFPAIRAWVGVEDGKGSRKALGEVEHTDRPTHRHFHVEIPNPIPAGAKIYVEVEGADGKVCVASFGLPK